MEETHLNAFIKDVQTLLKKQGITSLFPMVAVKNTVILILDVESLALQEALQEGIEQLKYPDQTVTFEVNFLHYHTTFELFQSIIQKIARFGQILCFDSSLNVYEIRNNLTSTWKLQELETVMKNATSEAELNEVLQTTFANTESLDSAKKIAIELYLMLSNSGAENSLDMACDFFRKVYSCTSIQSIYKLLRVVPSHTLSEENVLDSKQKSYIALLKNYVSSHLDAEYLSLKWLAENYLFISVGYLSKQFVKEEGERFSDYLNRIRMEEAKKLLALYSNDNIKDIAKQVGFGSNPHYFSQVFKKYVGCTPSEYWEKQKKVGI